MKETKVQIRRCGYNDTGFAFYLARCPSRKALAAYVAKHEVTMPPDMKGDKLPYGFYFYKIADVIPGIIDESHDGLLFEFHLAVAADVDASTELRHWRHEVGHVVANIKRLSLVGYEPEAGVQSCELPAYANEFLLASVDAFLSGSGAPVESGFPLAFPWLCPKEVK